MRLREIRSALASGAPLRDSQRDLLVRLLDEVEDGSNALAIGRGVLDVFGAQRGKQRPRDETEEIKAGFAVSVYRHRLLTVEEIAERCGWPVDGVAGLLYIEGLIRPADLARYLPHLSEHGN